MRRAWTPALKPKTNVPAIASTKARPRSSGRRFNAIHSLDTASISTATYTGTAGFAIRATVAVGMAVSDHPPHRPVLAALPHTVLTLDVTPFRVWRRSEHREMHEQFSVRVASNRRSAPVSPRWAAFGCAVPAHETSSGRPVA